MSDQFADLKSWSRAPRNLDEVQTALIAQAKKIGAIYGVYLSVGLRGDCLYFVDEKGDDVIDGGGIGSPASSILCATGKEVDSGLFLQLFAGRAMYAALTARMSDTDIYPSPAA